MLKTLPHLAWQPLILTEQRPWPERIDVGGWGHKIGIKHYAFIPSTYTGEIFGFINFEELNPTNKKLLGVNKVDSIGRIIGYKSL